MRSGERLAAAPDGAVLSPLGLQNVVIGEGALETLPDVVAAVLAARGAAGPVVVLSDHTPKRYRSADLLGAVTDALATRLTVRTVTVGSPGHGAHADEATLAKATSEAAGAGCVVAVGSGTVADIGKVVAAAHGTGYVIVQTADSVNGFADDRSVLLVSGVKRTTPTTWADALVVDTDVLVEAPVEMNVSGFADLIATFTAPADWYLATLLGMDDVYLPTVVALAREKGPALLAAAPLVPSADRAALGEVATTLTLSGISMGIAGTTAPCSGMEHAVSHLLEMATHEGRRRDRPARRPGRGGQRGRRPALAPRPRRARRRRAGARPRCPTPRASKPACGPPSPTSTPAAPWARSAGATARASWPAGRAPARPSRAAARDWPTHDRELRELLAAPEDLVAALRSAGAPALLRDVRPGAPTRPPRAGRWRAATSCAIALLGGRHGLLPGHLGRRLRRRRAGRRRRPRRWQVSSHAASVPATRRPTRLYPGYVFDLDGTVYLGDALLPHAAETIAATPRRRLAHRLRDQQAAADRRRLRRAS